MLSHDLNFFANCELHDKTSDELVEIWKNFLSMAKIFFLNLSPEIVIFCNAYTSTVILCFYAAIPILHTINYLKNNYPCLNKTHTKDVLLPVF